MKKSLIITLIMILTIGTLGIFGGTVNAAGAKTVEKDEEVSVTISLGKSVTSAGFDSVKWNSDKLEYISNSLGKSVSNGGKFGFFGDTEYSSVTFKFKAKVAGTATVEVNISEIGPDSVNITDTTTITIKEKQTTPPQEEDKGNNTDSGNTSSGTTNSDSTSTSKPSTGDSTSTSKPTTSGSASTSKPSTSGSSSTSKPSTSSSASTTTKPETNTNTTNDTTINDNVIEDPEISLEEVAPNKIIELYDENVKTLKNENTGVTVKGIEIALEDGIVLDVEKIVENNENYSKLEDIINTIKGEKKYYNIKLLKDNNAIQPNGYVTVFIPIPENFNKENVQVYYINEETSSYEAIKGEVQENYYAFTTNHFSTYVLVDKEDATIQETQENTNAIVKLFTNKIFVITILAILIIAIIATVVIVRKKK